MYHTYKDKQSRSGNKKRTKTVTFEDATQEVNTMKSHDEPIPKKNKVQNQKKKSNSYQANSDPSEDGRIYVIDRLNLNKPAHDLENDYG